MSKARQRERKKRALDKNTYYVEIPRGVVLTKFRALVDGNPVAVKGISGNKIILEKAPPKGAQVQIVRVHE